MKNRIFTLFKLTDEVENWKTINKVDNIFLEAENRYNRLVENQEKNFKRYCRD